MSRQIEITIQGTLGTNPVLSHTESGRSYCHFRVATTPSFRTDTGWREGQTLWFTAKAWGQLAENLARSLHKGDPTLLLGRFTQETWNPGESGRESITSNVITVSAGGHDLTRGQTQFAKVNVVNNSAHFYPAVPNRRQTQGLNADCASDAVLFAAGDSALRGEAKEINTKKSTQAKDVSSDYVVVSN